MGMSGVDVIKFKVVGNKALVNEVDAGGESVGGMSGGVGAVEIELNVFSVGMKGNACIVGIHVEHREEVHIKKERTKIIIIIIVMIIYKLLFKNNIFEHQHDLFRCERLY